MSVPTVTSSASAPRIAVDHGRSLTGVWIAFCVAGSGLFANQLVTLRKFKTVLLQRWQGEAVASLSDRIWDILGDWRAFIAFEDLAIVVVLLAAVAYLVYVEFRHGDLTALLARAAGSTRVTLALLMLATLVIARVYVSPGQVFMGDTESHMLRGWMFAEHFRQWQAPTWSNTWYGGFPLMANYGPLYFMATGLLTLAAGDVHTATKLLLWGCHVASVLAMFAFLLQATRHRLAAFVGAIAYGMCTFRFIIILYQGDVHMAPVFVVVPLLLWTAERFLQDRMHGRRAFLLVTLQWVVFILTHHGYAFFALVFVTIYLLVRVGLAEGTRSTRIRLLSLFAAAQASALAICAYLLIPFLFDRSEVRGMSDSTFPVLIPNPEAPILFTRLFRWAVAGDGSNVGYVGISIGLLAGAGAWHAIRRRDPVAAGITAATAAALLMVRDRTHYNIRNVDFFMLFLCALTTWGVIALLGRRRGARRLASETAAAWTPGQARVVGAALLLLVVDVGPATFQSVFRENYEFKHKLYRQVIEVERRPSRIVERQVQKYDAARPPGAFFQPTRVSVPSAYLFSHTPLGFFHEGSGRSFGYAAEILKTLHIDLNHGVVSPRSLDGLYLLGVGDVLFRDQARWFPPPVEPSDAFDRSDGRLKLRDASPLIVSRRVIALADIPGYPSTDLMREGQYFEHHLFDYGTQFYAQLVAPQLERMAIDRATGRAATLIARDPAQRIDLGADDGLEVAVESFATEIKTTRVGYRTSREAIGQLAFTYFPQLDVRLDGQPVPFSRSGVGTLLLRLPAGSHVITVTGGLPQMQRQMLWVSLAAAVGILMLPPRVFRVFDTTGSATLAADRRRDG